MSKLRATTFLVGAFILLAVGARAQEKAPLELVQSIPLPGLKDGDFDHFAVNLHDNRLFLVGEDNALVEVFDLRASKLIHTISDFKAPHSMVDRDDVKKLFIVDGGTGEVKIYDSASYQLTGSVKLKEDADSMVYDPSTHYMYVVNGGKDAHLPYTFISVVDTTAGKNLADIKIDADAVEALALEKSGPRLFANVTGKDEVAVIDRQKRTVISTWPTGQVAKHLLAMAFDEANHRLFVTTRQPGRVIVLDSDSGKVVTSLPCVADNDDMAYDSGNKRIYVSASGFIDVFRQQNADHYELISHFPSAFRARTAILIPEMNRYYLGVPRHAGKEKEAAVRIYKVLP